MEIKQASSYDLIDILFLLRQCVSDMNKRGFKQWNSSYPGPEIIQEDIQKGTLYIFTDLGIAKGIINLSDETPEEYSQISWKSNSDKILYIKRFAVHPFWKNSVIPEKLMTFAEQYAKEHDFGGIRLDVLDTYPADENFFKSRNFDYAGNFHSEFQKIPYACFEKNL